MGSVLPSGFYDRPTEQVARALLGCVVVSCVRGRMTAGRIVEVEAYLGPDDPAAHCAGGRRTRRTEPMFGPAGTAYVFFSYGMHWCLNVVTRPPGEPAAVLIRALEPLDGIDIMMRRRGVRQARALCSGPGKLSQALGVTGTFNGHPLDRGRLVIEGPPQRPGGEIVAGPRIGIRKAADWPLRFAVGESPWLSRPALPAATRQPTARC